MKDLWSSVLLEEYNNTKRCITIPVIADVPMDDVPDHIKMVATCLHWVDSNFKSRLLEALASRFINIINNYLPQSIIILWANATFIGCRDMY